MRGTIERYVLVDRHDFPQDIEYETRNEAITAASAESGQGDFAVVERVYVAKGDEDLVWTPTGEELWPPPPCAWCTSLDGRYDNQVGELAHNLFLCPECYHHWVRADEVAAQMAERWGGAVAAEYAAMTNDD